MVAEADGVGASVGSGRNAGPGEPVSLLAAGLADAPGVGDGAGAMTTV